MKSLFLLITLLGTLTAQAQETSRSTLLYPDLYEVITIDPQSRLSMAQLESFCNEEDYKLLVENFKIQLVRQQSSTFRKKENVLAFLSEYFGPDIQIQSVTHYGWEYLPTNYKSLFTHSKVVMKR